MAKRELTAKRTCSDLQARCLEKKRRLEASLVAAIALDRHAEAERLAAEIERLEALVGIDPARAARKAARQAAKDRRLAARA